MRFHHTYTTLNSAFYSYVSRAHYPNVTSFIWNESLLHELNLAAVKNDDSIRSILNGSDANQPYFAQAYTGHQYGHFTMLGDGRAMVIGEMKQGDRLIDLQLKGSGPTPYSRRGDGKATLQSMLREYLISEAMHHLGVPTTRSLAVFQTGELVQREQVHQGAMLLRVASSHIRVGTFQFARALDDVEILRELADYTIHRHYPQLDADPHKYLKLFEQVVVQQATLIAKWQSLGFVHGVMNTDNMTLSGETIDYGPCAFLDHYDPAISFSSIDRHGRYAYARQPYIASWNLAKLASTLVPLVHANPEEAVQQLNQVLSRFETTYQSAYRTYMANKLGIDNPTPEDDDLINDWLQLMQTYQADYTNSFVALTLGQYDQLPFPMVEWTLWRDKWDKRVGSDKTQAIERMQRSNPVLIPRNHVVKQAVDQADFEQDTTLFHQLVQLYQNPYDYRTKLDAKYTSPNPGNQRFVSYCGT